MSSFLQLLALPCFTAYDVKLSHNISKERLLMDIEEFVKRTPPRAKRSRLEPFRAQIFELKAKNYADWQIRDWLAENGLDVTRQAVQQYVQKHRHEIVITTTQKAAPAPNLGHDQGKRETPSKPVDIPAGSTMRQRGEAVADQYMTSTSANPLLSKITKEKK